MIPIDAGLRSAGAEVASLNRWPVSYVASEMWKNHHLRAAPLRCVSGGLPNTVSPAHSASREWTR